MESSNSISQERELQQMQLKERQMHSNVMACFKGLESHLRAEQFCSCQKTKTKNEVKAIKETEKWLNEAIPHEHKIEQSLNLQSKDVQINTVNALNVNSVIMEDKCNGKENSTLGRHLEEIHVTWAQFWKKPDKMTIWLEDGLKNQDQSVETASGKLVTLSKSHSDDVWKFVTPSESNSNDVWKFVTPSGSTVIKEALETLAWR
ncbi:hypothetical protein Tco_0168629 [Tanacetum coccineum]